MLSRKLEEVVADSDAVVVCTEWPEIREADWSAILAKTKDLLVVDANGFLATTMGNRTEVTYRQVGKPKKTSRQDAKTQRLRESY